MKYFLILILMVHATAYSQELSYSIYLRDVCNDSIYKSTYFSLAEIKNDTELDCINGTCTLSQAGTYKLLLIENVSDIPFQIELSEYKTYADTFNITSINELFGVTTAGGYYGFKQCNSPCNGICRDFYNNGNIRMEGNFVNGIPKGELKTYYRDGTIKEVREYSNRHFYKQIIFYDRKGQIIKTEKKGYRSKITDPFSDK